MPVTREGPFCGWIPGLRGLEMGKGVSLTASQRVRELADAAWPLQAQCSSHSALGYDVYHPLFYR